VHEPLRLTVVIDAPAAAIERVMATQEVVRQLVENGWLHLWRFGETGLRATRRGSGWPCRRRPRHATRLYATRPASA
jgi:uncharacterized protein YbcC (UPF0753/DUF2309 family)